MILSARDRVIYHIDAVTTRDIVNTVGSRDALLASFVHFYLRRSTALNALELAETFTSYKLGESGGANGFLDAPSVRKLAKTLDFDVYKIKEF